MKKVYNIFFNYCEYLRNEAKYEKIKRTKKKEKKLQK